MPIKIPNDLPAVQTLLKENIFAMTEKRAITQDIRPLRILLLNLMPKKIETETQLCRVLGNTPLQIELTFIRTSTHQSANTSAEHLISFYKTFEDVKNENFDGMIVTGAPVEHLAFEEVDYWEELCTIMEWSKTHVHSTMHICWGAMAGLYYHYGISKISLPAKRFGVYPVRLDYPRSMLLRGFDDEFFVPFSSHASVNNEQIRKERRLRVLASSPEAGIHVVTEIGCRRFYVIGHAEYDPLTLDAEYKRDLAAGMEIQPPINYYPNDDPSQAPLVRWRGHGNLLYTNWLNYFVYQSTPYDLRTVKDSVGTEDNIGV